MLFVTEATVPASVIPNPLFDCRVLPSKIGFDPSIAVIPSLADMLMTLRVMLALLLERIWILGAPWPPKRTIQLSIWLALLADPVIRTNAQSPRAGFAAPSIGLLLPPRVSSRKLVKAIGAVDVPTAVSTSLTIKAPDDPPLNFTTAPGANVRRVAPLPV